MQFTSTTKGVTVAEVLIGVAIFSLLSTAVTSLVVTHLSTSAIAVEKIKAVHLVREGNELVRLLRDDDWLHISDEDVDTIRYLDLSGAFPVFTDTPEVIDGSFTRSVTLREAYRDADNDLVASTTSGASVDADTRWVMVRVTGDTHTIKQSSLLTNFFDR